MKLLFLAAFASSVFAQANVEAGARVFRQTCSVGYCHGSGGGAGRAPILANRGLAQSYIAKVVAEGIPNTGMPGFKSRLSPSDFNAVMAYVLKINGAAPSGPIFEPVKDAPAATIPAAAQRGKQLFFDPIRGVRCGTCHAAEQWGLAVGPNLASGAPSVNTMRDGKGGVQLARAGSESFPAVMVETKGTAIKVFDVTVAPPVLRTFATREVRLGGQANWKHAEFVKTYADADLTAIGEYLKWLAQQ